MVDLAYEETHSGDPRWQRPLSDAQTFGSMTLLAANDYAACYAQLFAGTRAPVFGHLVQVRAVLEACVVSAWLCDPKIDSTERTRRALCELLYSAKEIGRLRIEPEGDAATRLTLWKDVADALGWAVTWGAANKPTVDGASRPSVPAGIDQLLLDSGDAALGRVQWSYLSAVSHVTWYGLRQSFLGQPNEGGGLGPSIAPIGTESKAVNGQSLCLLRALRTAGEVRMTYMGWLDDEWKRAREQAVAHEVELLRRLMAARVDGPYAGVD
jgi:hypothetical protein